MPNGIELILEDHANVKELFAAFDKSADATLIGQVVDCLKAHDEAEQAALYPFTYNLLRDNAVIERSALAHSSVKKQIDVLATLEGRPLVEAFGELRRLVDKHVADEQDNILPAIREAATPQQLDELGARILQAKQRGG